MSWRARALGTCLLWLSIAAQVINAQSPVAEYRLKAAFLHRFPEFVTWPSAAFEGRPRFELCVANPTPFGTALSELTAGDVLNGRAFAVREVDLSEPLESCHVLFIGGPMDGEVRAYLQRVQAVSVLTVGESSSFLEQGGIINLRVADGRVGFEVNLTSARRASLQVSSQMLRLALRVRN
jgi:hypothetical protein